MAKLLENGDRLRRPKEDQFHLENWIDTAPFEDLLGICIESVDRGRSVLTMPFTVKLSQGGGVLHGGAMTTLADTAVAIAAKTNLPNGLIFGTIELNSRFVAPVREGLVTATATVSCPQGRELHGKAVLVDEEEREVMHFTAVFRIARGQGY